MFIAHSLVSHRPFLDLRLLLDRNYSIGLALIAIFGMLNFTPMVLLPPLMRVYMGYPDVLVGQVVGSRGLGGLLGFFAVIFLSRLDPRISVGVGFALQLVAGIWLMRIDLNVTPVELAANGAIQGLSSGIIVVALTLVTFANVPRERMPGRRRSITSCATSAQACSSPSASPRWCARPGSTTHCCRS